MTDIEDVSRYPLDWPLGWKRTPRQARAIATFKTSQTASGLVSVAIATKRLQGELDRLGAQNPVLSSNVSLRLDGRPRSDDEPTDVGVAVYFRFQGRATVLACDRYTRVGDNIAALAAHIDALRRIERYGVGTIEQALAGYRALPADTAADWRAVFGFAAGSRPSLGDIDRAFKAAAKTRHPDVGGSEVEMAHLNRARDYACMELEGKA